MIEVRGKLIAGITAGVLAVFLCGAAAGAAVWQHHWRGKIMPGVQVVGTDLGGLTRGQAKARLQNLEHNYLTAAVTLTQGGHSWQVTRAQLGFTVDSSKVLQTAYQTGRDKSFWPRVKSWWRCSHTGVELPLQPQTDRKQADKLLTGFSKQIYTPPKNAQLRVNNADQIQIIPGRNGQVLEGSDALAQLSVIDSKSGFGGSYPLQVVVRGPKVTTDDVRAMKVNGVLGSFTTSYASSNANRRYNIHLAAQALDAKTVKPGAVLSFNGVVGPRTKANGYKEAIVIEEGQFVPGMGGGVCQVSTTLYNSVLLAGLDIVERYNHSLQVHYVPLGRDATVAYGGADLKFRNSTSGYLYIKASYTSTTVTFKIFGNTAEKKQVTLQTVLEQTIQPQTIKKNDPTLYQGETAVDQGGTPGYRSRTYRSFHTANGVVKKLLSHDYYRPVNRVVRVGTKPPQKKSAKAPDTASTTE